MKTWIIENFVRLALSAIRRLDKKSNSLNFRRQDEILPWDESQATALKDFFESHIGKAFLDKLEEMEFSANAWCVQELANGKERAFITRGIQILRQNILNMGRVREQRRNQFSEEDIHRILSARVNGGMASYKP